MLKLAMRFFLIGLSFSGCSGDDLETIDDDAETIVRYCPELSNRKIIDTVESVSGTIEFFGTAEFHDRYIIRNVIPESPKQFLNTLFPCNFGEEFKEDGLQVKFNGYILSIPNDVVTDVLGHPLVVTEMSIIDD